MGKPPVTVDTLYEDQGSAEESRNRAEITDQPVVGFWGQWLCNAMGVSRPMVGFC